MSALGLQRADTREQNELELEVSSGEALPAQVLRDQLAQIRDDEGLKQGRIAAAVGVSPTAINLFLQDKYSADDGRLRLKITQWLASRRMRATLPKAEYVDTSIARQIHAVLSSALANSCLGLIVGPSGIGKDMAIYEYSSRLGERVKVVEADRFSCGRSGIIREVAAALGLPSRPDRHSMTVSDIRDTVIERLRASRAAGGPGILLIVNECHLLDYEAIETLRRLCDKTATGAVLVGTARLAQQLNGRGGAMYEQVRRRCHAVRAFRQLDEVSESDVKAVAESVAGRRLGKGVLGKLCDQANSQVPGELGKLGRVAALVRQAVALAGDDRELALGDIDNAVTLLAA